MIYSPNLEQKQNGVFDPDVIFRHLHEQAMESDDLTSFSGESSVRFSLSIAIPSLNLPRKKNCTIISRTK